MQKLRGGGRFRGCRVCGIGLFLVECKQLMLFMIVFYFILLQLYGIG